MREMKDSGIEWIGKIPNTWKIVRIKNVIKKTSDGIKIGPFGSALANKTTANGKYNVYSQANLISGDFTITKNTISEETYQDLIAYKVIPGDICVSMMGTIGKCKKVPININPGIMDSHLIKLRLDKDILPRFFEYVYDKDLGGICYDQMMYLKKGTIMDGLNTSIIKQLVLPLPSIQEQSKIIGYLDHKCSQIDAIIARQQEVIEELKAYKLSVISEVVTKGLDPNVPMKDSRIEWVGRIPKHWQFIKTRYVVKDIGDIDHYMPESVTTGIPYLMTGDLKEFASEVDFDMCKQVSLDDYLKLSRKLKIEKGDLIFARYATIGTVCLVDINRDFLVSYSCVIVKSDESQIDPKFLMYYYKSSAFEKEIAKYSNANTQSNVGKDSMYRARICLPPLNEQNEIVRYLDDICDKIKSVLKKKQVIVDRLIEYKRSLICETVTGKKEV